MTRVLNNTHCLMTAGLQIKKWKTTDLRYLTELGIKLIEKIFHNIIQNLKNSSLVERAS